MNKNALLLLFFFLFVFSIGYSQTQGTNSVSLTTAAPVILDFDDLNGAPLPDGIYYNQSGANITSTAYPALSDGSTTDPGVVSFGTTTERSLGTYRTRGTGQFIAFAVKFTNTDVVTISSLNVSFRGEQWKRGIQASINSAVDQIQFDYAVQTGAAPDVSLSWGTGPWTNNLNLNYQTDIPDAFNASPGALDGNNALYQQNVTFTLTGLAIQPGESIWLRWTDKDIPGATTGSDFEEDGLSIDDLTVTASTTPPSTELAFTTTTVTNSNPSSTPTFVLPISVTNFAQPGGNKPVGRITWLSGGAAGQLTFENGATDVAQTSPFDFTVPDDFGASVTVNILNPTATLGAVTYMFQLSYVSGGTTPGVVTQDQISVTVNYPNPPLYFRSVATGLWTSSSTWESSAAINGSYSPAIRNPDSGDAGITIQNGHTVTLNTGVTIDEVTIASGGVFELSTGSADLNDGTGTDLIVNGTLLQTGGTVIGGTGTIQVNSGGAIEVQQGTSLETYATDSRFAYADGAIFRWNPTDNASLPTGTYFSGSSKPILEIANSVSAAGDVTVNGSFRVTSGNTFTAGANNLALTGDFTNNGTFDAGTGTVTMDGSTASTISGNTATFNNLTINNTAGVTVTSSQQLSGTLTMGNPSAKLNAGTDLFTFLSNASGDASLAAVPSGAQVNGSIIVQRFLANPLTERRYRYLASPVTNSFVSDWKNEIEITGTFTDPSTGTADGTTINSTNPSMFTYNEATTGNRDQGYLAYPSSGLSSAAALTNGKGYALFVRRSYRSTPTVTIDTRGTLKTGNVSLPFSYTNNGNINEDGWNLLGNPYAAPISWPAIKALNVTGLTNTVYLKDNVGIGSGGAGTFVTHDGTTGTNGFNGFIASGQAFFVKATASGSIPLTEAQKTTSATFYKTTLPNIVRIQVQKEGEGLGDDAVIYFKEGAGNGANGKYGALKYRNDVINFSTFNGDTASQLAINAMAPLACESKVVGLSLETPQTGSYNFRFSDFADFDASASIVLRDLFTGNTVDIRTNPNYSFQVSSDASTQGNKRFQLVFNMQAPAKPIAKDIALCGQQKVTLRASGASGVSVFRWYEVATGGNALLGQSADSLVIEKAQTSKSYYVAAVNTSGCESLERAEIKLSISQLPQPQVRKDSLTLTSSIETGNQWLKNGQPIEGATSKTLVVSEEGKYSVRTSNDKGCVGVSPEIDVRIAKVTAVEPQVETEWKAYPIPVEKELYVVLKKGYSQLKEVLLINSTGVRIRSEFQVKEDGLILNTSNLAKGLYILRLNLDKSYLTVKFVKE
jgi:hypothetical protein